MKSPDRQTNISANDLRPVSSILSHAGFSQHVNEDYALVYGPDNREAFQSDGSLFIVADGSGTWMTGEEASSYAARQAQQSYFAAGDMSPADRLNKVFQDVNRHLFERSGGKEHESGTTTLVAAVVRGNRLTVANIGNSRAYLIHDGQAQQITRDHDLVSELIQMGGLSVEEVEQAGEHNRLTRSLGGQREIDVDVFADIPLYPGDVILLCSDGLTRYVDDEQIALLVGSGDPAQDCRRLINWAVRSGGEDNATVIVVVMQKDPKGSQEPASPGITLTGPGFLPSSETQPANDQKKPKSQPVKWQWIVLPMVLGALLIVALLGKVVMNKIQPNALLEQPTGTPLPLETSSLPANVIPQITHAASTAVIESTPIPEQEFTPFPSVSASGEICVWQVEAGQSLYSIIRRFDLEYSAEDSYYYLEACDKEQLICSGNQALIESHGSIYAGWYIVIPVEQARACEQGEGIWVQADEKQPDN